MVETTKATVLAISREARHPCQTPDTEWNLPYENQHSTGVLKTNVWHSKNFKMEVIHIFYPRHYDISDADKCP